MILLSKFFVRLLHSVLYVLGFLYQIIVLLIFLLLQLLHLHIVVIHSLFVIYIRQFNNHLTFHLQIIYIHPDMSTNQQIDSLKQIINALDDGFLVASEKTRIQKDLFLQYIKIFQKFSQKLALLANKINEEVLSTNNPNDESIVNIFQHLSNTLLRMADCSRKVAIKSKNQIFQPIKVFSQNYSSLNGQILKKLKYDELDLQQKYYELNKIRESYISSSEKLEKQRQVQSKMMTKIENGDMTELERFNHNIKKITQTINQNQSNYTTSVQYINESFARLRKNLNQTIKSVSHNEESRISFCQKNVINSIKILQDFSSCFDPGIEKKIDESLKSTAEDKPENLLHKKLSLKIALLATSRFSQEFVSFQQVARRKRKKSLQQQNSYLNQIFNKVKETDKEIMENIINPWFPQQKTGKSTQKVSIFQTDDTDLCKEKIMSVQPYSFYFVQQVYQKVQDLASFYCKLDDQDFLLLLNIFQTITNNLQIQSNTTFGGLGIELLYKMTQISMRIMWRKNKSYQNKAKPIQLLCQQYGKRVKKFSDQHILNKLLQYIQKKKAIKKRNIAINQSKGVINSFTKGISSMLGRKKQVLLSDDEIFNCLQQLTHIMANLLVPTEISLPFIKQLLGNNENSRSFQYLKGILFAKKDQEQRQKIFYRTQIKQKKEQKMRKVLQTKKVVEYCLWITAKRGFLNKSELNLRLVSSQFKEIHQQILCRLDINTKDKWIHMIPFNQKMQYIEMKQAVAQNSVPSSIQQIITLDVNRSLHNHGEYLNPTILHSLLRTYAYFHKEISYCQGMNYIAGYLYIKTRNEESAYRIFQYMMEVRFKQLFANQFQVLKVKMYQFQRLLAIFHPQISDHFKKQSITSECYIVSWMITLFASSYQYTMESYLIDVLWQRFIVWGWRQFFRFVLSLFNLYKQQLIELTYDKALHFLGQMGRSKMFLADKKQYLSQYSSYEVVEGLEQYPITQEMLQNFLKEYKLM